MSEDRFERYRGALVGAVIGFGRKPEDADEIAQDVIRGAMKHAEGIARGAEWAYLRSAAFKRAINHATRQKESVPFDETKSDKAPLAEVRLIEAEENRRFQREFKKVFSELSPMAQKVLILRSSGHDFNDIARKLNITAVNARTLFSRAAKVLRERVENPPPSVRWLEFPGDDDDHEE